MGEQPQSINRQTNGKKKTKHPNKQEKAPRTEKKCSGVQMYKGNRTSCALGEVFPVPQTK